MNPDDIIVQSVDTTAAVISLIISIAFTAAVLIAEWRIFAKAGEAGWKVLIPVYNNYILFKIIYGEGLKFLFLLVPGLNAVFSVALCIRMAHVFGKSTGFGILNIFFTPITLFILAFGSAEYKEPIRSFL